MLESSEAKVTQVPSPRVLPKDHKVRFAVADCQRGLDMAAEELQRFRQLWFVEDPPRMPEAREVIQHLLEELHRIRNGLLELKRIVEPI